MFTKRLLPQLGQTALHISILEHQNNACKCLLEEGCNPDVQDVEGRTALMIACHEGLVKFVKMLLSSEADTQLKNKKGL